MVTLANLHRFTFSVPEHESVIFLCIVKIMGMFKFLLKVCCFLEFSIWVSVHLSDFCWSVVVVDPWCLFYLVLVFKF